jgi:hypothetical protein
LCPTEGAWDGRGNSAVELKCKWSISRDGRLSCTYVAGSGVIVGARQASDHAPMLAGAATILASVLALVQLSIWELYIG